MSDYTATLELNAGGNAAQIIGKVMADLQKLMGQVNEAQNRQTQAIGQLTHGANAATGAFGGLSGVLGGMAAQLGVVAAAAAGFKRGFDFNKTMETTRTGIGAVLLATRDYEDAQGNLVTGQTAVNAALADASAIQKELQKDAMTSAASYLQLTDAFQSALAPAAAASVTNLEDVREITLQATQAMAALGIPTIQAAQEIRGIFSGEINPDNRLNQILRVTKADLEKVAGDADAAGKMFKDRLAPFAAMAAESTKNLTVRLSNLGDVLDQALGSASIGLFKKISSSILDVSDAIDRWRPILTDIGTAAEAAFETVKKTVSSVSETITKSLGAAGTSWRDVFRGIALVVVGFLEALGAGMKWASQALSAPVETIHGVWTTVITGIAALLADLIDKIGTALSGIPGFGDLLAGAFGKGASALRTFAVDLGNASGDQAAFAAKAEKNFGAGFEGTVALFRKYYTETATAEQAAARLGSTAKEAAKQAAEAAYLPGVVWSHGATKAEEAWKKFQLELADMAVDPVKSATLKVEAEYQDLVGKIGFWMGQGKIKFEDGLKLLEQVSSEKPGRLAKAIFGDKAEDEGIIAGYFKRVREQLSKEADWILESQDTMHAGLQAGWLRWKSTVTTTAESTAQFVVGAWDSMGQAFERSFASVLTGKVRDLGDVFRSLWSDILGGFSKMLSQMVMEWLSKQGIFKGLFGGAGGSGAAYNDALMGEGMWVPNGGATTGLGTYVGAGVAGYAGGSAVGGMSGAPGFSTGAAIGGTAAAVGIAAAVAAGASLGSVVPVIGTIIGAIIGGLIGVLSASNTEMKVPVRGSSYLAKGIASDEVGGNILKTTSSLQASLIDIFKTGAPDGAGSFAEWMNQKVKEYLLRLDKEVHAGSNEDIQADLKYLIGTQIPREILAEMFGRNMVGQDLAGITGGQKGTGSITAENVSSAPLTKMLNDLGFSLKTINYLADQVDQRAPEELLTYLKSLVGIVVAVNDLKKKFAMGFDDYMAEIEKAKSTTAADAFGKSAQELKDLASQLSMYVGDEQLKKAQELIQLADQRYQAELAYLTKIRDAIKSIEQSIDTQLLGIWEFKKNPEWLASDAWQAAGNAAGAIAGAKSPEEVQRYVQEAQAAASQILEYLVSLWRRLQVLATSFAQGQANFGASLASMKEQANDTTRYWQDALSLHDKVKAAQTLTGEDQIKALEEVNQASQEMYGRMLEMVRTIAKNVEDLHRSIAQQVWDVDYAMASKYGSGQGSQVGMIKDRVAQLQGLLAGATDPNEVKRITDEIQALMRTYFGLFGENDPNRQAAADWTKQVLAQTQAAADAAYARMNAVIEEINDKVRRLLGEAAQQVHDATAAVETEIRKWEAFLKWLRELATEQLKALAAQVLSTDSGLPAVLEGVKTLFTDMNTAAAGLPGKLGDASEKFGDAAGAADRAAASLGNLANVIDGITGRTTSAPSSSSGNGLSAARRSPRALVARTA